MVVPRKLRDVVLSVGLLVVPLLFLQANLKQPDRVGAVDRLLLRASAPIQVAVVSAAESISSMWRRYVGLIGVEADNDALRRRIRSLEQRLLAAEQGSARLRTYERLLSFRSHFRFETVGARVTARGGDPARRRLKIRIDRGGRTFHRNMAVITADGVVGRISRVFGAYSDVQLAVDPASAIDVVVARSGARGLLRGLRGSRTCRIDYLLRSENVRVGDEIRTSGAGGVFPRGLLVGRISKVSARTHGMYQEVDVAPAIDFGALQDVLVVVSPAPPEVESRGSADPPASGLQP